MNEAMIKKIQEEARLHGRRSSISDKHSESFMAGAKRGYELAMEEMAGKQDREIQRLKKIIEDYENDGYSNYLTP